MLRIGWCVSALCHCEIRYIDFHWGSVMGASWELKLSETGQQAFQSIADATAAILHIEWYFGYFWIDFCRSSWVILVSLDAPSGSILCLPIGPLAHWLIMAYLDIPSGSISRSDAVLLQCVVGVAQTFSQGILDGTACHFFGAWLAVD